MSAGPDERWLRWYPRAWRERYGDELVELVAAMSADGRMGWRARLDLLRAGGRERLREWGLGGGDPRGRVRAGVLLVLSAWAPFLIGGAVFQRFSENWRLVTPASDRALPAAAYDTLIGVAVLTGVLVIAGIALALPPTIRFLRGRNLRSLEGPLARAVLATGVAIAGFLVVLIWSHALPEGQRNGSNTGYGVVFFLFGLAAAAALATWTALAVRIARLVELPASVLRIERRLAVAVGACMVIMLAATGVWWGALAHAAPWALHDDPVGTAAPLISAQLLIAGVLMAGATAVATTGVVQALRAGRRLPGESEMVDSI